MSDNPGRHKKFATLTAECKDLAKEMLALATEIVQDKKESAKVRARCLELMGTIVALLAVAKMSNARARQLSDEK